METTDYSGFGSDFGLAGKGYGFSGSPGIHKNGSNPQTFFHSLGTAYPAASIGSMQTSSAGKEIQATVALSPILSCGKGE